MLLVTAFTVNAQNKPPKAFISGVLIKDDGKYTRVLFKGTTKSEVFYKNNLQGVAINRARINDFSAIFMFDPWLYRDAKELYQGRKYEEALALFIECKEVYKSFRTLDNNYSDMSAFYELECYRKLKRYADIDAKMQLFISDKLTRLSMQTQLKVYNLWQAVDVKNWARLNILCGEWREKRVAISIRSQIAYCHGLALEGLGQTSKALNAYATAMTADFTKSDVIVREAALNSLRIFANDQGVKTAMSLWGKKEEDKDSAGYSKLKEANALSRIYDKAGLGAGVALPSNYKKFQEFTTEEMLKQIQEREDAAKEDAAKEDAAKEDAAKEDAAKEDAAKEDSE